MSSNPPKDVLDAYQAFSASFVEQTLATLWQHWGHFGVGGHTSQEGFPLVLDPEAMLWLTWQVGRADARLFDEVLRWCCYFGEEIDISRLNALLKERAEDELYRVAGAFARSVVEHGGQKRWATVAKQAEKVEGNAASVFLTQEGSEQLLFGLFDPQFEAFGLLRGSFRLRGQPIAQAPMDARGGLRFLLRRLFGVGTRAESLVLLLSYGRITPKEAAYYSGFTVRGMQQSLQELASTGMVLAVERPGEKRRYAAKSYELDQEHWWSFLAPNEAPAAWVSWWHSFMALAELWRQIRLLNKEEQLSPYKICSRLKEGTELAKGWLDHSVPGMLFPHLPSPKAPNFFESLEDFWQGAFAALHPD